MSPGGLNTALESTWSAQSDLPVTDVALLERIAEDGNSGVVGCYEIRRRLGEGEFAAVYEVVRSDAKATATTSSGASLKGPFALKAINKAKVQRHTSLLKSKRNIRRVNAEVTAMKRMCHAGVCELFDVAQSPTTVYLVMEMGERDLFTFVDDYPEGCPEDVTKAIARILALALRHCHKRGVAHRDLKPENILICGTPQEWALKADSSEPSELGIVKLCDFGLCAATREGAMLNDFVGSPGFFAPELMTRRQYDGAIADMWSLGAVMIEIVLGHRNFDVLWCPPYEHLHDVRAFAAGIDDAVARVKLTKAIRASEPLHRLFDKLLQIEPEKRSPAEDICTAPWFDLLKSTPEGLQHLLRLTFDHDSPDDDIGTRRIALREAPMLNSNKEDDGSTYSVVTDQAQLQLHTEEDNTKNLLLGIRSQPQNKQTKDLLLSPNEQFPPSLKTTEQTVTC